MHMPTISFHLGTKERGGRVKKKTAGDDGGDTDCLFIWNIFFKGNRARGRKRGSISSCIVKMTDLLSQ